MPYQDRIRDIGSDPERLELAYQDALKAGEGDASSRDAARRPARRPTTATAPGRPAAQGGRGGGTTPGGGAGRAGGGPGAGGGGGGRGPGTETGAAAGGGAGGGAGGAGGGGGGGRGGGGRGRGRRRGGGGGGGGGGRGGGGGGGEEQVLALMGMHLPVLAWSAVGLYLLWSARDAANRFAFLIKSLELFIAGGLFGIACGLFVGISMGMFAAIAIEPPEIVIRLFVAGGGGLVPVLAAAICYDPRYVPARQSFEEGLSRFIATLMRVLFPLTLVVLAVYVVLIPLHFRAAFENRDVLIVYNGMLFAVLALLVGATPVPDAEPTGRTKVWLRRLMVAIALLALGGGASALPRSSTAPPRTCPRPTGDLHRLEPDPPGVLLTLLVKQARVRGAATSPACARPALARAPSAWALCVVLVLPLARHPAEGERRSPARDMVLAEPGPLLRRRKPAHLPARGRPQALGQGHPHLRDAGLHLGRRPRVCDLRRDR